MSCRFHTHLGHLLPSASICFYKNPTTSCRQVQGPPETRAIPAGPLPAPLVEQQAQVLRRPFVYWIYSWGARAVYWCVNCLLLAVETVETVLSHRSTMTRWKRRNPSWHLHNGKGLWQLDSWREYAQRFLDGRCVWIANIIFKPPLHPIAKNLWPLLPCCTCRPKNIKKTPGVEERWTTPTAWARLPWHLRVSCHWSQTSTGHGLWGAVHRYSLGEHVNPNMCTVHII